ncbi:hypothetical protein CEXT_499331 [Caerostris extrusa]|uniref:Uncharacterized protein n=1 Tax=Caerostris extrusa TaxID=172846 RepID=A0AAV4NIJ9_CAEEX|nr:hypothetical protein CEXT_499331 [Caerostris extrusa]
MQVLKAENKRPGPPKSTAPTPRSFLFQDRQETFQKIRSPLTQQGRVKGLFRNRLPTEMSAGISLPLMPEDLDW